MTNTFLLTQPSKPPIYPGLAFIAYPQAVAMMPFPQLWSICFFVMIILLGLDTQFVGMEVVMTSIIDMFPMVMRRAGRRERFLLLFCLTCFFSQLVMITEGGMYLFQLFEYYACNGACILFPCLFETLAVGWIFGAERLYGIIKDMTGVNANPFFKICWLFLTPLVSLGSFICSLIEYQPLTFNRWYVYPTWAYVLGWVLALSSILLVPGWALYKLGTGAGNLGQRFHQLCQSDPDCSLTKKRETELQHIREEDLQLFTTT
ncbi:sodium- and chloride-dependent GABA transporter 2-like [Plectropomus leopardus]|uniref:sodium- and chloride-dependent GABA transporter 2-like n=1 Tax=Plectropomus leopardus TaxID=160734 RepID=UPI001C4C4122|nr:sodium- and chloride-dependent GABA transporter 2-like [Plectropomus leopardus]